MFYRSLEAHVYLVCSRENREGGMGAADWLQGRRETISQALERPIHKQIRAGVFCLVSPRAILLMNISICLRRGTKPIAVEKERYPA
jgi:hypothetical protein